jgi:serine protease Do
VTALLCAALLQAASGPDPFAGPLAALRERVGRSVVAVDAARVDAPDADPEGRTGSGQVAQHRDYYNRPSGPASGVIWSSDGFVLTSRFNVSGKLKPGGLRVTLFDGRELPAELLGQDEGRDVALLRVKADGLPALPKADLARLGQGSFLALVGRSPDRGSPTINLGILSALDRMNRTCVQTDAEMNYGNAGGALVNLRGELVGVACQIRPEAVWGQSGGVGFACKVAEIEGVFERLKAGEFIPALKKAFLGLRPGEGDPEMEGYQVGEVVPDSPAAKAGVKKGDVLQFLDDVKVVDFETLGDALQERKAGDTATLRLKRKDDGVWKDLELQAVLEARARS